MWLGWFVPHVGWFVPHSAGSAHVVQLVGLALPSGSACSLVVWSWPSVWFGSGFGHCLGMWVVGRFGGGLADGSVMAQPGQVCGEGIVQPTDQLVYYLGPWWW